MASKKKSLGSVSSLSWGWVIAILMLIPAAYGFVQAMTYHQAGKAACEIARRPPAVWYCLRNLDKIDPVFAQEMRVNPTACTPDQRQAADQYLFEREQMVRVCKMNVFHPRPKRITLTADEPEQDTKAGEVDNDVS